MSRLFISHSSKDNIAAKAFKQWLAENGWLEEDVFLDLDNIGAGERWKEALTKANRRCEAVVFLASAYALSSPECLAEVRKAENDGKEIIVGLLQGVDLEDNRLDAYKDRQIVHLMLAPQSHKESVDYGGERYEVGFNADALDKIKGYLENRGIAPDHFSWPPRDRPEAPPYPGLSAFTEDDAGIFFGRDADILRGLDKLRILRRNTRPRIFVIQAASGAGKSSYLRAGLWPRLARDADFTTLGILRPANGIITAKDGLGSVLAKQLTLPNAPVNPGDINGGLMSADLMKAKSSFRQAMQTIAIQMLERRRVGDNQARPPALVLAVDQAEELFASDSADEGQRFLSLIADLLSGPPSGVEPYLVCTIRSDSIAQLSKEMADRELELPEVLLLLPLPQSSYRDITFKPLAVIAHRGERLQIEPALADRLISDAVGADALPLLAFTLAHLYQEFGAGGKITLTNYEAMGGVAGSLDMAVKRALSRPGDEPAIPSAKAEQLTRMRAAFIPWLARIDFETELPMRRVAKMDEMPETTRPIVRRLVEARLLISDQRGASDVIEVAHESLLRQWPTLTQWLKMDAADLKAIEAVEHAANEWARNGYQDNWLDHRGERLRVAERAANRTDFRDRLGSVGVKYIESCRKKEGIQRGRKLLTEVMVGALAVALLLAVVAWDNQGLLNDYLYRFRYVRTLSASELKTLNGKPFQECSHCPDMAVIPAGAISMGSKIRPNEQPPHSVTISEPFAVSQYEITFEQWDACARYGDCNPDISEQGWGRGKQPVINVSWQDAEHYVAWLKRVTNKDYSLLAESQWEYAARAGSPAYFSFGDDDAKLDQYGWFAANAAEVTDTARHPHQVGQKSPNKFGLYDVHGNVSEWVEDCYHENYREAPSDGSVWKSDNCTRHVVRGGSYLQTAGLLRSASRDWHIDKGAPDIGFRVARRLDPTN